MQIRIGFTGAGGTGKTTSMKGLVEALKSEKLDWIEPLPSVARQVLEKYGTSDQEVRSPADEWKIQKEILERRFEAEMRAGSFVSDRTLIDHLAYVTMRCWSSISDAEYEEVVRKVQQSIYTYDLIVRFPIYWRTPDDATRSTSLCYQSGIQQIVNHWFNTLALNRPDEACTIPRVDPEARTRLLMGKVRSVIQKKEKLRDDVEKYPA